MLSIPLNVATEPSTSNCLVDYYWQVIDSQLFFYGSKSSLKSFDVDKHDFHPQCNKNSAITEHFMSKDAKSEKIKVVYISSCKKYIKNLTQALGE